MLLILDRLSAYTFLITESLSSYTLLSLSSFSPNILSNSSFLVLSTILTGELGVLIFLSSYKLFTERLSTCFSKLSTCFSKLSTCFSKLSTCFSSLVIFYNAIANSSLQIISSFSIIHACSFNAKFISYNSFSA